MVFQSGVLVMISGVKGGSDSALPRKVNACSCGFLERREPYNRGVAGSCTLTAVPVAQFVFIPSSNSQIKSSYPFEFLFIVSYKR